MFYEAEVTSLNFFFHSLMWTRKREKKKKEKKKRERENGWGGGLL
jgi:hypothetical protein